MSNKLRRIFREPLVQFLIMGGLIYGAYAMFGVPDEEDLERTIVVDGDRVEAFAAEWERRWNRPPTRDELDGVVQQYVKEEILYRQAVTMGLGENDPFTRRRMAQKLEFLTKDLSMMRDPAEGELEAYFQENLTAYREPDQMSFFQVFFDPDKREDATLNDAKEALVKLKVAGEPDPKTFKFGDRSMLQDYFSAATELEIRRQLGSGFADSVKQLEAGEWHGPVLSGYGVHLVYVFELQEAPAPAMELVRDRVLDDWHKEQAELFHAEFLEALKEKYDIVIEELPADRFIENRTNAMAEEAVTTGKASEL